MLGSSSRGYGFSVTLHDEHKERDEVSLAEQWRRLEDDHDFQHLPAWRQVEEREALARRMSGPPIPPPPVLSEIGAFFGALALSIWFIVGCAIAVRSILAFAVHHGGRGWTLAGYAFGVFVSGAAVVFASDRSALRK